MRRALHTPMLLVAGVLATMMMSLPLHAQETIFTMWKDEARKADACFADQRYRQALNMYLGNERLSHDEAAQWKIARCYYFLHQPFDAVKVYDPLMNDNKDIPILDLYYFAESLSATKQYDKAIRWYEKYQKANGDDNMLTAQKIWRLKNREYLFEDSARFEVKPLTTSVNSDAGELSPLRYQNNLIFLSNRSRAVFKRNEGDRPAFFKTYISKVEQTLFDGTEVFSSPLPFSSSLRNHFQEGSVALYDSGRQMVYAASGEVNNKGKRNLQLYFASLVKKNWELTAVFAFNNPDFSFSDPAISEDGQILYFSSDMKGGFGRKDIYRSVWQNNAWSKPKNLGDQVNTAGDETSPAVYGTTLYFTSNGHAGLGGLDIFKVSITGEDFGEVTNMGYPVNTNFDDFALTVYGDGAHGYMSSNRRNNNDDVYAVAMDLQSYPMSIAGTLKYKEESWRDSSDLKILSNATMYLIDNQKNRVVENVTSSENGSFTFTIPYFSQYRIKVVSKDIEEAYVSLELSRSRHAGNTYDIVVVKNAFEN